MGAARWRAGLKAGVILISAALVAAALGRRNQPSDMRAFVVGQITRVSLLAAVATSAVLRRPHRCRSWNQATTLESQMIQGL